jgi:hypothetical protein
MKYTCALIVILFCLIGNINAQETPNMWKTLAGVTYIKKYDDFLGFKVDFPVFSEELESMEGQVIEIRGYIIPIEGYKSHKEFIFSAYPYNMCFFCGGAGPETVMEIVAKEPIKYTAEAITIRGNLKLNNEDINQLMYSLVDVIKVD